MNDPGARPEQQPMGMGSRRNDHGTRRGWEAGRQRRTRGSFGAVAGLTLLAGGTVVLAQSAGTPPPDAGPGTEVPATPRSRLIEGTPRPGIVIIDGQPVTVAPPATGPGDPGPGDVVVPPGAPEDATTGDASGRAPGTASDDEPVTPMIARRVAPRELRPGESFVTGVEILDSSDQGARALGLPTAAQLARTPVQVAMRGDRLVAPSDELDLIDTTIGELADVAPIWQRSVLPVIEAALEQRILQSGLFASVRVRPPSRTAAVVASAATAADPDAAGEAPSTLARIEVLIEVGPFPVAPLLVEYAIEHPRHIPVEDLLDHVVRLGVIETDDGVTHWMAPSPRREVREVSLREIGAGDLTTLYGGAMRQIVMGLRDRLSDAGLIGLYVLVDPEQITVDGRADLRGRDETALRVLIYTGIIKEIRTLGFGERLQAADSRNHPVHRRIIQRSPIQPWAGEPLPEADETDETEEAGASDAAMADDAADAADANQVAAAPPTAGGPRTSLAAAPPVAPRPSLAAGAVTPPADDDEGQDADGATVDGPAAEGERVPSEERRDLIMRRDLSRYLNRLNRFPGRRVDAALSPHEDGGAVLDYLVAERRPLLLYTQVSNTGTEETDRWRYRIGFNRTQLTNNDDILSMEYVTAGFSESHAINLGYEAPVGDLDLWRWRAAGSWSEFTASDIGFAGEEFVGDSWSVAAEVSRNVAQWDDWFLDVYAGLRFQSISVQNRIVQIDGETQLLLPNLGVRLEHASRIRRTNAFVQVERNLSSLAGTEDDDLNRLGRLFVDDEWTALQWGITHSFYLEPIFNRAAWADLTTRSSSTLAHELLFSFTGQHAFGARLIPQAEQVVGGMFSVRGYPESVVAGDDVYVASLEYRLHLPRVSGYADDAGTLFGQPFRWVPQEPYGEADWDLVAKAFVDAGISRISDPLFFESGEELVGAGVGLEFAYRKNLTLRLDWGFALQSLESRGVDSGDNRVHFSATLLF